MRRGDRATTLEVRAVFAPDRLAGESLERAYARLVPAAPRRERPPPPPVERGGVAAPQGGKP